jgi:hypothetical protein
MAIFGRARPSDAAVPNYLSPARSGRNLSATERSRRVSFAVCTPPISRPADLFDNAIVRDGGIEHWCGILRGRGG